MTDEWERLGRKIAGLYLINRLNDLSTATHTLDGKIRDGEDLTKADIRRFRNALADLQGFVENDLTAVAEGGVESYDAALLHVHNQALVENVAGLRSPEEIRGGHA